MRTKQHVLKGSLLEVWLKKQSPKSFPAFDKNRGEISFPKRYDHIKTQLLPYHRAAEKGALLKSAKTFREQINKDFKSNKTLRQKYLIALDNAEPLVYLNNHGEGHIDKVIHKCSELLDKSKCGLTAYEGYLLLSAIQFHDVGNIFGREEHEQKCKLIMEQTCSQIIKDSTERNTISHIAMAHGGCWNENPDTISSLSQKRTLFECPVREQFLAALLRFSDELADDSTRADRVALDQGLVDDRIGKIYHLYSAALHSVTITNDSIDLAFEFSSNLALQPLRKNGKEKYLLDEIYSRTLKMERERRYSMMYLRPLISISRINVEIIIQSETYSLNKDRITYTLEERGYPNEPCSNIRQFSLQLRTGKEEHEFLRAKKWKIKK